MEDLARSSYSTSLVGYVPHYPAAASFAVHSMIRCHLYCDAHAKQWKTVSKMECVTGGGNPAAQPVQMVSCSEKTQLLRLLLALGWWTAWLRVLLRIFAGGPTCGIICDNNYVKGVCIVYAPLIGLLRECPRQ